MDQLPPLAPLYSPRKLPKTRQVSCMSGDLALPASTLQSCPGQRWPLSMGPAPARLPVPLVGAQTPIYLGSQERPLLGVEFPLP